MENAIKRTEFDINHNPDNIWKIIIALLHEIQESIKIDLLSQLPLRINLPFKIQISNTDDIEHDNIHINRLKQNDLITDHTCYNDKIHGRHGMHQFYIDVYTSNKKTYIPIEGYQFNIEDIRHVHVHMNGFPCLSPETHDNTDNILIYRLNNVYYCPISNSLHICNVGVCRTEVTRDGRICTVSGLLVSQIYDVEELWTKNTFSDHREWVPTHSEMNIDQQNKDSMLFNVLNEGSIETIQNLKLNVASIDISFEKNVLKCSKQTQFRSMSMHFNRSKSHEKVPSIPQLETVKSSQLDSMSGIDKFKSINNNNNNSSNNRKQELLPFTQNILSNVRDVKNGYNSLLNIAGKVVFDILFSDNRMKYVYQNNENILCQTSENIYKYLFKHSKERKTICMMNVLNIYNEGLMSLDSYATRVKRLSQTSIDNLVTYYAALVLQVYINIITRTPDGCILSYNFTYYETFVAILFMMRKHHCVNIISLAEKITKTQLNDIYFKSQLDHTVTLVPSDEFIQNAIPSIKFLTAININYTTISTIQNNIINAFTESLNTYKISPYMLEIPMLDIDHVMLGNTGYTNIIEGLIVRRCQQIVACARFIKESESIMLWDKNNFDLSISIDKRNIIKEIMKCNNLQDNLPIEYIINCRKVVGPFGPPSIFMKLNVIKDKMVALRETSILNIPKDNPLSPLYQAAQKYLNSKNYIHKNTKDSLNYDDMGDNITTCFTGKRKRQNINNDNMDDQQCQPYISIKEAREMIKVKKSNSSVNQNSNDTFVKVIDTAPWL